MSQQTLTLLVGVAGVVVGWLTSGYQRVTEKLIEERRSAYAELLEIAEPVVAGADREAGGLQVKVVRAELVCSPQMERSGLIRAFSASAGTDDHQRAKAHFLAAARADSTVNSMFLRVLMRRRYRPLSAPR